MFTQPPYAIHLTWSACLVMTHFCSVVYSLGALSICGGKGQFRFDALPRKETNNVMQNEVREMAIAMIDQGD